MGGFNRYQTRESFIQLITETSLIKRIRDSICINSEGPNQLHLLRLLLNQQR